MGTFSLPVNEAAVRSVLLILLIGGIVVAAATIVLFVVSLQFSPTPCGLAMCMGPLGFRPIFELGRWYPQATIPGIDKNTIGLQLSLTLFAAFYFGRERVRPRWIWPLAALLLFIGVVVTFSKGALASLAFGLLLLVIRRWFRLIQVAAVLGVVGSILAVSGLLAILLIRVLYVFQFVPGVSNLLIATSSRDSSDRFATVPSTVAFFLQHPLTGIGPMNLERYQGALLGGSEHNFYLRTLAETGIVGEAGFLTLLVALILLSIRAFRRNLQSTLGDVLAAGLVVLVADLFVAPIDYSFFVWGGLLLAWTALRPNNGLREPAEPRTEPTADSLLRPGTTAEG
jgi:O-antigen ligase